ncbi:MAG TPA: hypothetical protein P5346_07980 [Spirochaetota bacterium]|nr:hypothetical protein [Spirochaetota bacterium]HSA14667.1 hypothetical protein [Spirochaetota bacterium]
MADFPPSRHELQDVNSAAAAIARKNAINRSIKSPLYQKSNGDNVTNFPGRGYKIIVRETKTDAGVESDAVI